MRIYGRLLVVLITLASMNVWGGVKSKQEISTEAEYLAGHIQGAQWFPRGKLEYYIQDLIKDPDSRIVLYCRTGGRSALATLTLQDMGYTNVVDLDGGFKEWVAEGNTFYNLHGENQVVSYQKKE
jgi:rhodanese-related sulfurtransferase